MSPLPSLRLHARALVIVSFCLLILGAASTWATLGRANNHASAARPRQTSFAAALQPDKVITPAGGATITVNTLNDGYAAGDGFCGLLEAIEAANLGTTPATIAGDCTPGSSSGPCY